MLFEIVLIEHIDVHQLVLIGACQQICNKFEQIY